MQKYYCDFLKFFEKTFTKPNTFIKDQGILAETVKSKF